MFLVDNIKFKLVGYYKIIFYTEDNKANRREVEYIIIVEDTEAPNYFHEETLLEGTVEFEEEYDEDLVAIIKTQTYQGKNEEEKLASYVEEWIRKNIKVTHNYHKDANLSFEILEVKVSDQKVRYDYLVYEVKLVVRDSSGNEKELTIFYRIKE